jgi:hypothetical protein
MFPSPAAAGKLFPEKYDGDPQRLDNVDGCG